MNIGIDMANLDRGSFLSGWESCKSFVLLQNAHFPSLDPDQFGSRTRNILSSELRELSQATAVQLQKEVPWMAGMMTLELSHYLPTFPLFHSPFRPELASAICHAFNILVKTRGGLECNRGKYAAEGNVTAWGMWRCTMDVNSWDCFSLSQYSHGGIIRISIWIRRGRNFSRHQIQIASGTFQASYIMCTGVCFSRTMKLRLIAV
jgi:hypothetical protein